MKKFLKFEFSIYGGNVFVFLAFRYVALLYHSWGIDTAVCTVNICTISLYHFIIVNYFFVTDIKFDNQDK